MNNIKEIINHYYNLNVNILSKDEAKIKLEDENFKFLLFQAKRTIEELNDIYQICEELKQKNIPVHTFILNKENKIITKINNQSYILLKLETNDDEEMNIIDIMNLTNEIPLAKLKSNLYRNNWGDLWEKKIDYFEHQIHELGKDKKIVLNSFSYYIGLAENAISYANNTNKKYQITNLDIITLCHKRLEFPNKKEDYFNPLFYIFDLEVRDISEYIKSAFFESEQDAWIELRTFLKNRKMSPFGYQMFYARMLYPSYYFDVYEKIMHNEINEEKLLKYIDKVEDYEQFLKNIYIELRKIYPIEQIDWLK